MIVDVHAHVWRYPEHFTAGFCAQIHRTRAGQDVDLTVTHEGYQATAPARTRTIVFGGKARLAGVWVEDAYVADYAAAHADRVTGFLSLDPTQDGWEDELRTGHRELGLRGIKLMPMYAGFSPDDRRLDPLWRYAQDHGLPVLLHTGTTFIAQAPIEHTLPRRLDPVAIRFPQLRLVLAHLGHPYEGECVAVIRKHPNVYADISALHYRPWQFYNSLMLVQEYGVWDKLLFGSDYPFTTVNASIEGLRNLNTVLGDAALPRLDEQAIESLIHRDAMAILRIEP